MPKKQNCFCKMVSRLIRTISSILQGSDGIPPGDDNTVHLKNGRNRSNIKADANNNSRGDTPATGTSIRVPNRPTHHKEDNSSSYVTLDMEIMNRLSAGRGSLNPFDVSCFGDNEERRRHNRASSNSNSDDEQGIAELHYPIERASKKSNDNEIILLKRQNPLVHTPDPAMNGNADDLNLTETESTLLDKQSMETLQIQLTQAHEELAQLRKSLAEIEEESSTSVKVSRNNEEIAKLKKMMQEANALYDFLSQHATHKMEALRMKEAMNNPDECFDMDTSSSDNFIGHSPPGRINSNDDNRAQMKELEIELQRRSERISGVLEHPTASLLLDNERMETLQSQLAQTQTELTDLRRKLSLAEREKEDMVVFHNKEIAKLNRKMQQANMRYEHQLRHASDEIESLRRKYIRDSKDFKHKINVQESHHTKFVRNMKNQYGNKVEDLSKVVSQLKAELTSPVNIPVNGSKPSSPPFSTSKQY